MKNIVIISACILALASCQQKTSTPDQTVPIDVPSTSEIEGNSPDTSGSTVCANGDLYPVLDITSGKWVHGVHVERPAVLLDANVNFPNDKSGVITIVNSEEERTIRSIRELENGRIVVELRGSTFTAQSKAELCLVKS